MKEIIHMQSVARSALDYSRLCSIDYEAQEQATLPLIHKDARFLLVKKGNGIFSLQGQQFAVSDGSLISILPWQVSEITRIDSPLQYTLIAYHYDTVEQAMKLFRDENDSPQQIQALIEKVPVIKLTKDQYTKAQLLAENLRKELGVESMLEMHISAPLFSNIQVISLLVQMLILFCRCASLQSKVLEDTVDGSRILRYMYLHCSEKLTLQMLSDIFYISRSTVSSWITELTGLSFFDLLNEMRIGKTVNYLLYTDLTLKELAEILGYVDESHISKVFAARIGCCVTEFKDTYRKIQNICQIEESQTMYLVVNMIYRNYTKNLTAKNVSQQFGMTVEQLNHFLLCHVERNFRDFLNYIRVNRASELLASTSKSIADIAEEVGFHNIKTFSRNFLKFRKMTAKDYRLKIQ